MKSIIKMTILLSIILSIVGCGSKDNGNTSGKAEESYSMDSIYADTVSTDTLKFTDAFRNNYPASQEGFDEDMDKGVKEVERNCKMTTKEGKEVIEKYKKFMEHEKKFVHDNWDKYDEIEQLIKKDKEGIKLEQELEDSIKKCTTKSRK